MSDPAAPTPTGPRSGERRTRVRPGEERRTEVAGRPRRPRRPRRSVAALLVLATLALLAVPAYGLWALGPVDAGDATTVVFEVPRGRPASGVARDLRAAGMVRDARVASAFFAATGVATRIGEGLYDLRRDMGVRDLSAALVAGGRPRTARVLLPEGIRVADVAERVRAAGWSDEVADALAALLADPPAELRPEGLPDGASLEGYAFPATYDLPVGFDAPAIVRTFVARFERELSDVVRAELDVAGLDVHAWVTLASMVQAEAGGDAEMPIIAGVFLNRLDRGMALQSDPTVAYGLGKALPELDVTAGDFAVDHPWNTYLHPGLPAGPIANPGAAALAAVLAPERVGPGGQAWLYFLHGVDGGTPVFRPNVDYADHLRDIDRYLR